MYRVLPFVVLLVSLVGTSYAAQGLIEKTSAYPVDETVRRVEGLLERKGIHIFAVVDHKKNAQGAGLELNDEVLIVFGNPRLGTPLMQSNPTVGIDLPMKILVWRDAAGQVRVAYNDPAYLVRRHGIADRGEVVAKMSAALRRITDAATTPD